MKEAIILAGGFGTRLKALVDNLPKPMAQVAGRPFLCHVLGHLSDYGYGHVVLSTGYMAEKIEHYFGPEYLGMKLSYAREESPLGTGGAIVNALALCSEQVVTALNGDTLFRIDYNNLENFYNTHPTRLAIVLRHVPDTSRYGSVDVDSQGRITRFIEKNAASGPGWINGGIYMMNRSLLAGFAIGEPFSFEHIILEQNYKTEPIYAYGDNAYFIDIGLPSDYLRAQNELSQ
ncbi:MAG: nucleotidyltransferase family protein [Bacteroidales bacterium]|nr:nucleotidyltransferase family protein [Bacteroidales bacterium]